MHQSESAGKIVLLVAPKQPLWFEELQMCIHPISLQYICYLKTEDILRRGQILVLAVGGDGILSACVNCLDKSMVHVTVYNVPLGTSNDFHFGSMNGAEFHLHSLANAILGEWNSVKVNVSLFSFPKTSAQRTMINIGSMGISSQIKPFKRLGRFGYIAAGLLEALKNPSFTARIQIDGEWKERKKTCILAICNGKCFGGRIFIGGSMANPLCQERVTVVVAIVQFISLWRLIWLFVKLLMLPKVQCKEIEYHSTQNPIQIQSINQPMAVEIDGDVFGELPCTITPNYFTVKYLLVPRK